MNPLSWFRNRAQGPITDESVQALRTAAAEAQRSRLPQMAAALSYRTVFGLIPMLVVALLMVRVFTTPTERKEIIQNLIEYTGIQNIEISGTVPALDRPDRPQRSQEKGTAAAKPDEAQADLTGPPAPKTLGSWITDLVSHAGSSTKLSTVGIVGVITLLYAAVSMLVEIERAFNQIFRVPRGRSWIRRMVNYWTLLTLGGVGLALTFYVGTKFQIWAQQIIDGQGWGMGTGAFTINLIGYGVTVLISTVMLTILYASVPNTRVKPGAALVGGFMGALLWEAGKWGFGQYISYSAGYAKLYGSLALVPLFLLWVYYTWLIVLFGLAVTYQFQHGRLKTRPQPLSDFGPTIIEPSACLLVMAAMARAMAIGTPQTLKQMCQTTGLSEAVVSLVVARFAERGLLLRVEREGESVDVQYTLARNPAMIRVGEVLSLGFELAGGPEANPVVERMRRAQIDAAGSESLADIAGNPGEPRKKPAAATATTSPAPTSPPTAAAPAAETPARTDGPVTSRTATL